MNSDKRLISELFEYFCKFNFVNIMHQTNEMHNSFSNMMQECTLLGI